MKRKPVRNNDVTFAPGFLQSITVSLPIFKRHIFESKSVSPCSTMSYSNTCFYLRITIQSRKSTNYATVELIKLKTL